MLVRIFSRLAWYVRRTRFSARGVRIGARSYISKGADFTTCRVTVGDDVFANKGLLVEGEGTVTIGNNVRIGPRVTILTTSHDLTDDTLCRATHAVFTRSVTIGHGAWIGASATILPGVEIGQGCVVAAGAVVIRDVVPDTLVAGVPARTIRSFAADARSPHDAVAIATDAHGTRVLPTGTAGLHDP